MVFLIPLNKGKYVVDCGDGQKCKVELGKSAVTIVSTCDKHKDTFKVGESVNCLYEVRIHSIEKLKK